MLISTDDIKKYLSQIPPVPDNVLNTLKFLKEGRLKEAAIEADKDIVLKKQIENVVNSAYFSLPNKVEDTVQLFSLLGIEMVKSLVYSYLVTLLEPKEWKFFKLNFYDFQAVFMSKFKEYMILEFGEDTYKRYAEIGALVPATVCVCDSLFADKKEQVEILLSSAPLDFGSLLKRMTGFSLFGLAGIIAKEWGMEEEKIEVLKNCECEKCDNKISALVHLLFFYLSSQKSFLDLNSLISFNPEVINLIPKTFERISNGG